MEAALKDAGVEQVDLSAVRITVLSPNGVKKEEGDCSPLGYYFVSQLAPLWVWVLQLTATACNPSMACC